MELMAAAELVSLGLASWANNRGRSIRMKALRPDPEIRGLSCHPGASVIMANAEGKGYAKAITEAWA